MQQTNGGARGPERDRNIDTVRTEALSDGIFAIATTLLVLNLEVPDIPQHEVARRLPQTIADLAPSIFSYALSFLVVAAFWMAHRAIFRHIMNVNRPLSWLNILFLMVIAFLPFSTGLFDRYAGETLIVVVYVGNLALARLMLTAIWWYASAHRALIGDTVSDRHIRFHRARGLLIPLVFVLSIGVAYVSLTAAVIIWIALAVADQALLHAFEPSG